MYYILVRLWSLVAFGISVGLIYFAIQVVPQGNEVSLMLGCGGGIVLWMLGIVALSTWLQPKRTKNYFENTGYSQFSSHRR